LLRPGLSASRRHRKQDEPIAFIRSHSSGKKYDRCVNELWVSSSWKVNESKRSANAAVSRCETQKARRAAIEIEPVLSPRNNVQ
jgi:hypothetical protein